MATGDGSNFWNLPGPPGFDQVNADYQTYLGRPLSQAEYQQYWANKTNYSSTDVSSTPEAAAHQQSLTQVKPLAPGDPGFNPNVNNPTTWDAGANRPAENYPGWHWDPTMARYVEGDATPAPPPVTPPPPATTTGGGGSSSGSGGGASSGGGGWTAPQGPPGTGFGSPVSTYTPPVYASDPNAPVYTPGPPAPDFTPLPAYVGPVYTADGTGTTGDGTTPTGAVPGVVAPTWTGGDFANPTMEEVQAGPGYQSRLDALIKSRERQSAAQGTILSGGTLKALDRAGQDYATNEYQTYRTNALENYKQRYGRFTDAVGMDLAARTQNANETQNAFGNAMSSYGANANQNQQTFQNQNTLYTQGNARTLSDYLTNVTGQRTAALDAASAKRNAETDYWSRLQDLNQTGSTLAGGSYRV
jgi:hypothetical protein